MESTMRLVAENGNYVRAEFSGGVDGTLRPDALNATKNFQSGWGVLTRVDDPLKGTTQIKVANQHYVTAERGGGGAVSTNRSIPGPYETYRMKTLPKREGDHFPRVMFLCQDGAHLLRVDADGNVDAQGIPGMAGTTFLMQEAD